MHWIDTHCHLDALAFWPLTPAERTPAEPLSLTGRTQLHEVKPYLSQLAEHVHCVLPAVAVNNFEAVRTLAHTTGHSYCLGIHPLYVDRSQDDDLARLDAALTQYQDDPRLVAVGEIGLDFFVPELQNKPLRARQQYFYLEQLKLARQHGLPVVLHSRRAVDQVLQGLRAVGRHPSLAGLAGASTGAAWSGIAHAFNGSMSQAQRFIDLGLKLGFGGAFTYERAHHLRSLASTLPLECLVLETDAPDMPPSWLYKTALQRAGGEPQGINSPAELPRIGAVLAGLRDISVPELAAATSRNAMAALPKMVRQVEPG